MNYLKSIVLAILIIGFYSCEVCPEITPIPCGKKTEKNSEYCGWTVATCYASNPNDPIGVIYDTRFNDIAPRGDDWGTTISNIHPAKWTANSIGQVFGIAIDKKENIYLASSDIYFLDKVSPIPSSNINRPYPCGQIFKCAPPSWVPLPFVAVPNSCGDFNGIGNITYDKWNDQFFASNLEDGKIYRISINGQILDSYDPFLPDDGKSGIAPTTELVWGLATSQEEGDVKVYFANIKGNTRALYSLTLVNGGFPSPSQTNALMVEFQPLKGELSKFTDIAISHAGKKMILAERGDPHKSRTISLHKPNNVWVDSQIEYFVGAAVSSSSDGKNCAGGLDFFYVNSKEKISHICDENIFVTSNYMQASKINGLLYGLQGIRYSGNSSVNSSPTPNSLTDVFIDFDSSYGTNTKGGIGDVEVFDCNECTPPCNLNSLIK